MQYFLVTAIYNQLLLQSKYNTGNMLAGAVLVFGFALLHVSLLLLKTKVDGYILT